MKNKILVVMAAAIMSAGIVCAEPTVNGPTGLIEMPTADALKHKEWNFAISFQSATTANIDNVIRYKVNIGTFKGLELGVIGSDKREGVFINAKFYMLTDNTESPLGLALGFQNLASFHDTSVYMVASKKFKQNFTGHIGFDATLQGSIHASLMTGLELFTMNNRMSFLMDLKGNEDVWKFNLGTRFYLTPELTVGLSFIDLFGDRDENKAIVGQISWTDFM